MVDRLASLREKLAVPYVLVAESVLEEGRWTRRLSYPELPGCEVESTSVLEAFEAIERRRVRTILELSAAGTLPDPPRESINIEGVESVLAELGFDDVLAELSNDHES